MKNPILVVMAAGMGSRYGGLKQIDPVDEQGHIIMDFSIYDAVKAGFKKVVFIIKEENEKDFKAAIGDRLSKVIDVSYVYQKLENIPEGFTVPEGRIKPFGTGHAILSCINEVDAPFAVINADDYYGKEAYVKVHDYLVQEQPADDVLHICMAGFRLGNTLSDNGSVTRGLCHITDGKLTGVTETHNIFKTADGAERREDGQPAEKLDLNELVSMNMWGLTPAFMDTLYDGFVEFLQNVKAGDIKAEYLLPVMIDALIQKGTAQVDVLETKDTWFGVTYQEDKEVVIKAFKELTEAGVYPNGLYK